LELRLKGERRRNFPLSHPWLSLSLSNFLPSSLPLAFSQFFLCGEIWNRDKVVDS
jgi:hypothetical protein